MKPPDSPIKRQEQEPASEEVVEVATGIYRLQLPISMPGLGHVNCYALEDQKGFSLIDPGLPGPASWSALIHRLDQLETSVKHVHTIVVTHSHPDHFGGVHQLRDISNSVLITHADFRSIFGNDEPTDVADLTEEPLEDADSSLTEADLSAFRNSMRRATPWGSLREPPSIEVMRSWSQGSLGIRAFQVPLPDRTLKDTQEITIGNRTWLAIHTPGHTHDHLCLYEPIDKIFLSGDHVLPTITPHIGGVSILEDPLATFIDSLDRMEEFVDVSLVLPAHGHPFADLANRAADIRRHHRERLESIHKAGAELGRATVETYMKYLFRERSWGYMAASETYAHLEHLRLQGKAERTEESGSSTYLVD